MCSQAIENSPNVHYASIVSFIVTWILGSAHCWNRLEARSHTSIFTTDNSAHHPGLIAKLAIALAFISLFFTVVIGEIAVFLVALLPSLIVCFTACCKVHKFAFYLVALLAFVCSILTFLESAERSCPSENGSCLTSGQRAVTIVTGVLWLLFCGSVLKIPHATAGDGTSPSFPQATGESA